MGNIYSIFLKNDDIIGKCPIKIDSLLYEYSNNYANKSSIDISITIIENNNYNEYFFDNQLYINELSITKKFLSDIIFSKLLDNDCYFI